MRMRLRIAAAVLPNPWMVQRTAKTLSGGRNVVGRGFGGLCPPRNSHSLKIRTSQKSLSDAKGSDTESRFKRTLFEVARPHRCHGYPT